MDVGRFGGMLTRPRFRHMQRDDDDEQLQPASGMLSSFRMMRRKISMCRSFLPILPKQNKKLFSRIPNSFSWHFGTLLGWTSTRVECLRYRVLLFIHGAFFVCGKQPKARKRALRTILRGQYVDYNSALHTTGLQSLSSRRTDLCRKFASKINPDLLPPRGSEEHGRNTRNANKLRTVKFCSLLLFPVAPPATIFPMHSVGCTDIACGLYDQSDDAPAV
ncbi:hypothetical protein Bbelb_342810 [Branchiostoma belcheri]|nr:hypothetical protein Bbelb_342810 [Branchiostoma belcheri]